MEKEHGNDIGLDITSVRRKDIEIKK